MQSINIECSSIKEMRYIASNIELQLQHNEDFKNNKIEIRTTVGVIPPSSRGKRQVSVIFDESVKNIPLLSIAGGEYDD